jgi:hypothetical protein
VEALAMLILVFFGFVLALVLLAAGARRIRHAYASGWSLVAMALGLLIVGAAVAARIA